MWRHLRGRPGRSVALLAGVLVATTGFVVLTGSAGTSRLQVTGAVQGGTRAAYDILVRPRGSRTSLEAENGLVRPNYLAGQFGGVSLADWARVRSVPGVSVAAPIAMVGYSTIGIPVTLDLTGAVDISAETQVIRIDPTYLAERGLSHTKAAPVHVYVTRRALAYPEIPDGVYQDGDDIRYSDGRSYPAGACGLGTLPAREVRSGGATVPICPLSADTSMLTARMLPDGRFETGRAGPAARLLIPIRWEAPFLLAAVDPAAEERLVGLTAATIEGRPLRTGEVTSSSGGRRTFPVLASSRAYVDAQVRASYTRVRPAVVPAGGSSSTADTVYPGLVRGLIGRGEAGGFLDTVVQPGPVRYERLPGGTWRATTRPADERVFDTPTRVMTAQPWLTTDDWFRPLTQRVLGPDHAFEWAPVGMFDPERLTGFSDVGRVPLETYEPPSVRGADAASRTALGGRPLLPSGNPGGYLTPPPMLLTGLSVLPELLTGPAAAAPISAIRVRVAGVDGYTPDAAERVRVIAGEIGRRTGLDVDITLGSSQAERTVELPAGTFGRPVLRVTERWSSIGVASRIVEAVDRKSVILFVLVLVVCALFLGNAVGAAVRDRRTDLAVLSCLGWPRGRIAGALLGEVAVLGLVAGLLSAGLAWPLGHLLGVHVSWWAASAAVPVALLLAVASAALPVSLAFSAGPRRAAGWRARSVLRLGVVNLIRVPGRTALGAAALAVGVAATTVLAAVTFAFQGAILGTVLGDAVAVTVRDVDRLAAAAAVLLGIVAVADVLYLNIRDRAGELAALRATGWSDLALVRLVATEGLLLGVLGATAGAGAGLAVAGWLVGTVTGSLLVVAGATAAAGVLVTGAAIVVPALLMRRLPVARLLAEE